MCRRLSARLRAKAVGGGAVATAYTTAPRVRRYAGPVARRGVTGRCVGVLGTPAPLPVRGCPVSARQTARAARAPSGPPPRMVHTWRPLSSRPDVATSGAPEPRLSRAYKSRAHSTHRHSTSLKHALLPQTRASVQQHAARRQKRCACAALAETHAISTCARCGVPERVAHPTI